MHYSDIRDGLACCLSIRCSRTSSESGVSGGNFDCQPVCIPNSIKVVSKQDSACPLSSIK